MDRDAANRWPSLPEIRIGIRRQQELVQDFGTKRHSTRLEINALAKAVAQELRIPDKLAAPAQR